MMYKLRTCLLHGLVKGKAFILDNSDRRTRDTWKDPEQKEKEADSIWLAAWI